MKNTVLPPLVAAWLLGLTVIDVTFESTTETDVDPVQAEHPPDEAVIVDDPDDSAVTKPPFETDTAVASLEDQATPELNVFWLPSLYVPVALICQV